MLITCSWNQKASLFQEAVVHTVISWEKNLSFPALTLIREAWSEHRCHDKHLEDLGKRCRGSVIPAASRRGSSGTPGRQVPTGQLPHFNHKTHVWKVTYPKESTTCISLTQRIPPPKLLLCFLKEASSRKVINKEHKNSRVLGGSISLCSFID